MLSPDRLREVLHYDPDTGLFRWRESRPCRPVGSVAGYINDQGYRRLSVDGESFAAHRLAWLFVHGRMPDGMIDHINGDPADNRISNLRDVARFENGGNRPFAPNRHGHTGIRLDKGGRWVARISYNGKRLYLGAFATKEEAVFAYRDARKRLRGEVPYPARNEPPVPSIDLATLPTIHPEAFSLERLRRLLGYDSSTGIFVWRRHKANKQPGKRAGYADNVRGYRYINIDRRRYYEHRLAWFYMHGTWPVEEIDHINGDPSDNRITNLREANRVQNLGNRRVSQNSKSGVRGVYLDPRRGTWSAEIKRGDVRKRLSGFATLDAAAAAHRQIAVELYGEFVRSP